MSDPAAALAVLGVAALYASVGHGGASGYLAVMTLLSLSPAVMKPGALLLNLLVAGIGAVNYFRAGHFRARLLWPFALASIPFSYIGATLRVTPRVYGGLLCVVLIWAGIRMLMFDQRREPADEKHPMAGLPATLSIGAGVGFLSGVVGVGGGIFLSPLVILMRWADPKETAALSAAFIWLNSAAGMIGHLRSGVHLPEEILIWVGAAGVGGIIGSQIGARRLSGSTLRRLLAVVLLIAAGKSALAVLF
ncbi:sulfite exporter TauE/SafE family protein [bacterium]|nr:sulfite exporter TauE/SafE family protein [bacterium]